MVFDYRPFRILNGSLMANELVDDWFHETKKGVIIKIDLEKAFDMVDWDFLDAILHAKGFGRVWHKWIHGCVSSANVSIIVNGRPCGKIIPTRGIRQDDPLSPFLFILVADCLSRLLDHSLYKNLIATHPIGASSFILNHFAIC